MQASLTVRTCALQEELPERLLGTCRLEHLDLAAAAHLDLATGQITRKVEDAA